MLFKTNGSNKTKSLKLLNEQTMKKEFGKDLNSAQMLLLILAVESFKEPTATDMSARRLDLIILLGFNGTWTQIW